MSRTRRLLRGSLRQLSRLTIAFVLLACLQTALLWRYFTHQWVA